MDPLQERHLQGVARLRGRADLGLGTRDDVEGPQQILAGEPPRERDEAIGVTLGSEIGLGRAGGIDAHQHHVADDARELATDEPQILT